jgi:hypothetical protein
MIDHRVKTKPAVLSNAAAVNPQSSSPVINNNATATASVAMAQNSSIGFRLPCMGELPRRKRAVNHVAEATPAIAPPATSSITEEENYHDDRNSGSAADFQSSSHAAGRRKGTGTEVQQAPIPSVNALPDKPSTFSKTTSVGEDPQRIQPNLSAKLHVPSLQKMTEVAPTAANANNAQLQPTTKPRGASPTGSHDNSRLTYGKVDTPRVSQMPTQGAVMSLFSEQEEKRSSSVSSKNDLVVSNHDNEVKVEAVRVKRRPVRNKMLRGRSRTGNINNPDSGLEQNVNQAWEKLDLQDVL